MSQEDFAHTCGLHRAYLGVIERGERNVTLSTPTKSAVALHVKPLDLLAER